MRYLLLMVLATVLVCGACGDDVRPDDDGGPDSDSDTDSDTDGDTDTDSDTDTDTDYLPMTDCEGGKYDPNSDLCWEHPYNTQLSSCAVYVLFWSSSEISDSSVAVWAFGFAWAEVFSWSLGAAEHVLCVRDGQ